MKYRNIKTNNYVETNGVICGEVWELVEEPKQERPKQEPKKTKAKAK